MTKNDTIIEFCKLGTHVGSHVFKDSIPHDCFCTNLNANFAFDLQILNFIQEAVQEKIDRDVHPNKDPRNHLRGHND